MTFTEIRRQAETFENDTYTVYISGTKRQLNKIEKELNKWLEFVNVDRELGIISEEEFSTRYEKIANIIRKSLDSAVVY